MGTDNKVAAGQIPAMPGTHGERMELMRLLGQQAAKSGKVNQLQQVFMVHEGWMSLTSEDQSAEVIPSQDPNRKEVLIISAIHMQEHEKQVKVFEILRDSSQQVIDLQEFLPDERIKDEPVKVPLLEAFVSGFQTAVRTKFN